jgi:5-formyltetrahydrofolate cyclo-ligase
MPTAPALREALRLQRRATSPARRHHAAEQLARRVTSLRIFTSAARIAGYLPVDGEIDPLPLLRSALEMGKSIYLPVLTGTVREPMRFAPYHANSALKPNRFGIPEPQVAAKELLAPQCLDLVFTPLVAFDLRGNRLGMGGGFYDRSFAFLRHPGHLPKPHLVGLAFDLQKVDTLSPQPWDVPLDIIVTESTVYTADHHRSAT